MHVGPEDDLSCVLGSTLLVLLRQSLSLAWGSLTRRGEQATRYRIHLSLPLQQQDYKLHASLSLHGFWGSTQTLTLLTKTSPKLLLLSRRVYKEEIHDFALKVLACYLSWKESS